MAMRRCYTAINGIDRSDDLLKVKFWARAWKAAHEKARAVGWNLGADAPEFEGLVTPSTFIGKPRLTALRLLLSL